MHANWEDNKDFFCNKQKMYATTVTTAQSVLTNADGKVNLNTTASYHVCVPFLPIRQ